MTITFGDIQLIRLQIHHLEMVRNWRNSAHIVSNMDHQEHISEHSQLEWFKSVDHAKNTYFVIQYDDEAFGLIHLANINFDQRSADSGLFIGVPKALGSPIPMVASLALLEFAFGPLRLKQVFAKVAKHNQKAINYNEWLGFKYLEPVSSGFNRFVVNPEAYYQKREQRLSLFKMSDKIIEVAIRTNSVEREIADKLVPNEYWTLAQT